MRSLTDFIACLPGVKPKIARSSILEGDILSEEERGDIFYRSERIFDMVYVVGPDAASAILTAYRRGKLPMNREASIADAPLADEYLAKADVFRAQIAERRRKQACVKDLTLVKESDFADNRLLDRIFWEHALKGQGTLKLAGIDVTKDVHGYKTNSGNNTGYDVSFSWIGSDGKPGQSGTGKPAEAFNRRNDQSRNWGLHE